MPVSPFSTQAELDAYYAKHGFAHAAPTPHPSPSPQKRALPSLQVRYPEEEALHQLEAVADAAGWCCEFAWNPTGRFAGLVCQCLRGREILIIQILREGQALSAWQAGWLDAWRATGVAEVYTCTAVTLDPILDRITTAPPRGHPS